MGPGVRLRSGPPLLRGDVCPFYVALLRALYRRLFPTQYVLGQTMSVPRAIDTGKGWVWNSKEYQADLAELACGIGVPVSILRLPQVLRKRKILGLITQGRLFDLEKIEKRVQLLYVKHFQKRKKPPREARRRRKRPAEPEGWK